MKVIYTPIFIADELTIAKIWNQPKCPSTDGWVNKLYYIHTMEYYLIIKMNEILFFFDKIDAVGDHYVW